MHGGHIIIQGLFHQKCVTESTHQETSQKNRYSITLRACTHQKSSGQKMKKWKDYEN